MLLDGEVVAFGDGHPHLRRLADRMHVSNPRRAAALAETNPVTLLVFDVLRLGDRDLSRLPLAERRELLVGLDLNDDRWQTPPTYDDGLMLLDATLQQGLEGIVSKRLDSRYEFGARSRNWLKFAHRRRDSYVVGGWRPETGSDTPARARCWSESRPPTGWSTAAGSAAASPARSGRMLRELLAPHAARRQPVRRRGAQAGRPRHPLGGAGRWWSTSRRWG